MSGSDLGPGLPPGWSESWLGCATGVRTSVPIIEGRKRNDYKIALVLVSVFICSRQLRTGLCLSMPSMSSSSRGPRSVRAVVKGSVASSRAAASTSSGYPLPDFNWVNRVLVCGIALSARFTIRWRLYCRFREISHCSGIASPSLIPQSQPVAVKW